jgi:hypothetical protein
MLRKMEEEEAIHENYICIQPPFSAVRNQFTGKQSTPFERALSSALQAIWTFYI